MTQTSIAPADNAPMNYSSEETEITLGTGKMLAVFFGLVILCAVFFGMGYSMGRNSAKPAPELLPPPATSSRIPQAPIPSPTTQTQAAATPVDHEQSSSDRNPAAAPAASSPTAASNESASPGETGAEAAASSEAKPPGAGYFVQVAAVTKQEDAEALVESLKGRQYQAFIVDPSPDQLFHVQLGPFAEVKEAEAMRTRLVNDGYNPILKK